MNACIRPESAEESSLRISLRGEADPADFEIKVAADGSVSLTDAPAPEARLTLMISAADLARLLVGELDAKRAMAQGRLRLRGQLNEVVCWQQMFRGSP